MKEPEYVAPLDHGITHLPKQQTIVKFAKDLEGSMPAPDSNPLNFLMHMSSKPIALYGGAVDPVIVKDRRKKNKAARKQRKINGRKH